MLEQQKQINQPDEQLLILDFLFANSIGISTFSSSDFFWGGYLSLSQSAHEVAWCKNNPRTDRNVEHLEISGKYHLYHLGRPYLSFSGLLYLDFTSQRRAPDLAVGDMNRKRSTMIYDTQKYRFFRGILHCHVGCDSAEYTPIFRVTKGNPWFPPGFRLPRSKSPLSGGSMTWGTAPAKTNWRMSRSGWRNGSGRRAKEIIPVPKTKKIVIRIISVIFIVTYN